jgi:hypothetical protein
LFDLAAQQAETKSLFASFSSEKEERTFFFEKKNQKTFMSGASRLAAWTLTLAGGLRI